jgi:hypothetical protein
MQLIPELPTRRQSAFAGLVVLGAVIALLAIPEPPARPAEHSNALCENGRPAKRSPYITYGGLLARSGFQRDHHIPLCLGGTDTISNVRYQPLASAKMKDREEWELCEAVCRGDVSLDAAVQQIMEDWP